MRERSWGNRRGGVGWGLTEFNVAFCICQTQGHSLRVTFPCSPVGFPPKTLPVSEASPPRPRGPSRLPGPSRSSEPRWPAGRRSPTPEPLQPVPGLLRLHPLRLPSPSPSSRRLPLRPPPAPGPTGARDAVPFLAALAALVFGCPPGAPAPAGLLRERPPPKSSRPRPAPRRIQFEASQDLPGPLVLG